MNITELIDDLKYTCLDSAEKSLLKIHSAYKKNEITKSQLLYMSHAITSRFYNINGGE